jgi:predicted transcriptional regulator of viral defense system
MWYDEFFYEFPVFTSEELARYQASRGHVGERAGDALLSYHTKAGRLLRVRRGLYAVVPPGTDPRTYSVDPFLIAGKTTPDAVLSHHTALQFHGRAYSMSTRFTYGSSHRPRVFTFRSNTFQGTGFPLSLSRSAQEHNNVSNVELASVDVRVTNLERTMVDVLDRPALSGGWEEIWRSLESVEFFDLDKILEYVHLLNTATTAVKVGFYLEQHRESLMVEERHLKPLREQRPRSPHYLDRNKRGGGRFFPSWNLIVPEEVVNRSWGEVL